MSSTAAQPLTLTQPFTVTPCCLLHNQQEVTSSVTLATLNPSTDVFAVADRNDLSDTPMSFTIAPDRFTILVHEPTSPLQLDWTSALALYLPPILIAYRQGSIITTFGQLGGSSSIPSLRTPVAVARSGADTDLFVNVHFDGNPITLPTPRAYCKLSWYVGSRPRSLRFAAVSAPSNGVYGPLILRPKKED